MFDIIKRYEAIALSNKDMAKMLNHENKLVLYPDLHKYDNIDDLLVQLAKVCIDFNLYRKDDEYYDLTCRDLDVINEADYCVLPDNDTSEIEGGYMFLDDINGTEGSIRLYSGEANPKWSFWVEDGKIGVDYC